MEEYKEGKNERLVIARKADRAEQNRKDMAKIKYNYKDFLNQFDNLHEQCIHLVKQLSKGEQECIICSNPIYQRSALWNCK
jgi:hypothetical protein